MAHFNSLLVTGNSRFLNPINGNARNGVYYVKGTQTASTGAWTGNIPVPALYDGLTIMYYLPYAGSGNATLNLTLSNGTTTGAINCYFRKTERLTTHFPSGSSVVMTYHPAGSITYDGTATTDNRWVVNASYLDGNDTSYYDRIIYVRATAGSNKVFPYTLVMRLPDGRWESIVTSSSTGTGKTRNTHGFLFGQLACMYYNETFAENALISDYRLWTRYTGVVDYRYSFNLVNNSTQGFTANKPIYLVGSIGSDGLFYIDANMWAKALPSSADGKIYMYIGDGFDWYRATFFGTGNFRAYVYTNGHIREFTQDAATVGGHTVAKDVPSNAVFTDNNTTYTLGTSGNNVTLTPSSGSANTITVPYATNASKVNNHTVAKDVPSNAVFTDTNTIAGMTDVQLTSPTDNDLLVYDSNLTGGKLWKNAKKIVTCTKAQFDNWSTNNTFPYTDCKYIVTDVNNLNTTSADIPYDSTGTASVKDKLDTDRFYDYGIVSISGTDSSIGTWMKSNCIYNKWCQVRVSPTDSSGYYGASSVAIMYNLSSVNYGMAICTSDNITKEPMRVGQLYGGNWTFTQMPYAYQLTPIGDKRNVATTPNDYRNKLVFQGLKQNSSIGNPTTAVTYSYVVGLCGWSDRSGGGAWEIAFNDKGIFIRREGTTQNTWANWVALYSG